MQHLIKAKYAYIWLIIIVMIFTSFILIVFSTYNVDKYFKGNIILSRLSDRKLVISSPDSYKINGQASVKMLINERYYDSEIVKIGLDKEGKTVYLVRNKNIPLIENSTLPVTIVYGSETIMDKIIGNI